MFWNILSFIVYIAQFMRHCLHYLLSLPNNLPHHNTQAQSTELPTLRSKTPFLYSITPSSKELDQIGQRHPLHPTRRIWRKPAELKINLPVKAPLNRAISMAGNLRGPLLQQGLIIHYQNRQFYLREELGQWPGQMNQVTTIAVDLKDNTTHILFLPITLFDPTNVIHQTSALFFEETASVV